MSIAGTYFSGESSRSHVVIFAWREDGGITVTGEGVALEFAAGEISVSDRVGDVPRFIYLPNDAVIETPDNGAVDAALAAAAPGRAARLIHTLESHRWVALGACIALVAVLALALRFAPPVLARAVARRVPSSLDTQAGEVALNAITPYFSVSALTAGERERVRAQLKRLRPGLPPEKLPRLKFRSMANHLPNAFALPGNVIVVTDELVRLPAHDDEVAAVLAHELGHLEARHGMQSVLRSSFALLIVTAVTGDLATLTSFAGTLPLAILTRGYARDMEREADEFARRLLVDRGIPTTRFSAVLIKLEAARQALQRQSTYLSTHPSSAEREVLFGVLDPEMHAQVLAEGESPAGLVQPRRPIYPATLRQEGISGEVVVAFVVDPSGVPQQVRVVRSTRVEFEAPAVAAVEASRFRPARHSFQPVSVPMEVPIRFAGKTSGGASGMPSKVNDASDEKE